MSLLAAQPKRLWLLAPVVLILAVGLDMAMNRGSQGSQGLTIHACSMSDAQLNNTCPQDEHSFASGVLTNLYVIISGTSASVLDSKDLIVSRIGQKQPDGSYHYVPKAGTQGPTEQDDPMQFWEASDGHSFSDHTTLGFPYAFTSYPNIDNLVPGSYRLEVRVLSPSGSVLNSGSYDFTVQ